MTCIVGAVLPDGNVAIGGDSAVSDHARISTTADSKVIRHGEMLIGMSGSVRMRHLMHHSLTIPDHADGVSDERYMQIDFVDAVRRVLKEGGYAKKENEVESITSYALIGYRGQLWMLESDYQVNRLADKVWAIGSGGDEAKGALLAMSRLDVDIEGGLTIALQVSADLTPFVRPPFDVKLCRPRA